MKDNIKDDIDYRVNDQIMINESKWGIQNHKPLEYLAILGEEVGEVNKAVLENHFKDRYYPEAAGWQEVENELIDVIATAYAMIDSMKRNKWL